MCLEHTQLNAQEPSRTCHESKEEKEGGAPEIRGLSLSLCRSLSHTLTRSPCPSLPLFLSAVRETCGGEQDKEKKTPAEAVPDGVPTSA